VISNPEPLCIILIFVISVIIYKTDDIESYKFYIKEREKDMANSINMLQGKIENLDEENKYLAVDKLNKKTK
jgi:hypothetical protein